MKIIQMVKNSKPIFLRKIYTLKCLLLCTNDLSNIEKLEYTSKVYESFDERIDEIEKFDSTEAYNILDNDYNTVESLLSELREDVTSKFKITSVLMVDNMKIDELIIFHEKLCEVMSKYQNIDIASNDIFYYSGKEISSFIVRLLNYIETHEVPNYNHLSLSILKEKTNIVTLSFKEWVQTIQVIKTTLKYLNSLNDNEIDNLRKDFILINVYYFIVITGGNN